MQAHDPSKTEAPRRSANARRSGPRTRPADWREWQCRKECELWEAIYLSMNIDPERMRPAFFQWMQDGDRRSPSHGISRMFCSRLTVALSNVSEAGPIFPRMRRLDLYQHPRVHVSLANVAWFFDGIRRHYQIPAEMQDLASATNINEWRQRAIEMAGGALKRSVLVEKYQSRWPTIERDLRDGHRNGLSAAGKVGYRGLWFERKVLDWANTEGKLHAARELPVSFNRIIHKEGSHPPG